MEPITKDNYKVMMQRLGFTVSRCGSCGLPLIKCFLSGVRDRMIEIRPTHTVHGSFVIKKNGAAAASGYLYDLSKHIEKHFPTATGT
jgi:hypothetical protein